MNEETKKEIEELTGAGYFVLPISPNEKRPAPGRSVDDATNDAEEATRLFANVDKPNVGIACVNLFVLDIDVKNGANGLDDLREMEATLGELPTAPSVETPSGGRHYYFKKPPGEFRASTKVKFYGRKTNIDVRTGRTYILAPPSTIDGRKYEREGELIAVDDLPELPDKWRDYFEETTAPKNRAAPKSSKPPTKTERKTALKTASGDLTGDDKTSAIFRCRKYLEKIGPAIEGQGGGPKLLSVCNVIFNGFALSKEDGRPLLEEYNERCRPPWNLNDAQDRRYFEGTIKKAIETPLIERGNLFEQTKNVDDETLNATIERLVADMNRKLGKRTAARKDGEETDACAGDDAEERDDDGFLSLERQKERRKEERERRKERRLVWETAQYRDPFPFEAVPAIIQKRIEYAGRTLNAEPSALFLAAIAAASSAVGYAAQVMRGDALSYLMLPCVIVGPTGAGKSPLIKTMAKPFLDFADAKQEKYALNKEAWRQNVDRKPDDKSERLIYSATSLTEEAMKEEISRLRNSQYKTCDLSTMFYYKDEAADHFDGSTYGKNSAAKKNAAFMAAFDGEPLSEIRVSAGDRAADSILLSAVFGVQPSGFNV